MLFTSLKQPTWSSEMSHYSDTAELPIVSVSFSCMSIVMFAIAITSIRTDAEPINHS